VFENLGMGEILLIMFFVLIFFGAKKIPDIAQGLGKGIREFRKAARDIQDEIEIPKENKKPEGGKTDNNSVYGDVK
jgi:sec-independent protein translocase protein TatA